MLLGTTDGEARNLPTYIAVYRLACKKQHEYFALSGAEQLLTSQVVSPTGSPGVGFGSPRTAAPSSHSGCAEAREPAERGAGWVGRAGAADL